MCLWYICKYFFVTIFAFAKADIACHSYKLFFMRKFIHKKPFHKCVRENCFINRQLSFNITSTHILTRDSTLFILSKERREKEKKKKCVFIVITSDYLRERRSRSFNSYLGEHLSCIFVHPCDLYAYL